MIDSHTHMDDPRFDEDRDEVIRRALAGGVTTIINIGYDEESSRRSLALADQYPQIYAAVGIHPHESKTAGPNTWDRLREWSRHPKAVAIGEIGLDYYYDHSPRETQQRIFREQIDLARELKKPIVIHDRDAHGDVLTIMKEARAAEVGGVFHCFSGSLEMAKVCLQMGFFLSFGGPLTFQNAKRLREVASYVPKDRVLIETDCPYLTPHPRRGQRNEPLYVTLVAEKLAEIWGIAAEEVEEITTQNAKKVFRLL